VVLPDRKIAHRNFGVGDAPRTSVIMRNSCAVFSDHSLRGNLTLPKNNLVLLWKLMLV
jgi:hypothetical protein